MVGLDVSRLRKTSWKGYAVRFAFGGIITAMTGVIATTYGAAIGGLFLGFPAILPASLTLIAKHSNNEKAGDDAVGAIAGSGGLLAFGAVVWRVAPHHPAWLVLLVATTAWFALSILLWLLIRQYSVPELTRRSTS